MPRTVPALTAIQIQNLKPDPLRTVELVDGAMPGLRLRITPSNQRVWSLNIRDSRGERRRFEIGTGFGLKEARDRAMALKARIKAGDDPTQERREARRRAREAREGIGTLEAVIRLYGQRQGTQLRSWYKQCSGLRSVFASLMSKPARELSVADFRLASDTHKSLSAAAAATRYVRPILRWAAERDLAPTGIAETLRPTKGAIHKRQRSLSRDELHCLLAALSYSGQDAVCRLLLLTGCRREEACGARWRDIDFNRKTFTVPKDRRKNTRGRPMPDLVIPLSDQALVLLQKQDIRGPNDLVFTGPKGGRIENWNRWQKKLFDRTGTVGWQRHDLRRTVATFAGELGYPPHIVEIILGHANPHSDLASVYNTSRYTQQHREALDRVGQTLVEIEQIGCNETDHLATNVVSLLRPR